MIIFVLFGERVAIFPVVFEENRLDNYSSMSVVIGFMDVLLSSDFYHLFTFSEIMPLVFKFVLELSLVMADSLIINIFVVDVSSS